MTRAILDCYTDEPAGLGVPPFIGVWPRYIASGYAQEPAYLTIDDLRLVRYVESTPRVVIDPPAGRTHIEVLNHTRGYEEIRHILENADELVIIAGVQTPGKYLSARPGTLREVNKLLGVTGVPPARAEDLRSSIRRGDAFDTRGQDARNTKTASGARGSFRKVLTGPVLTGGTQFRGGARPQLPEEENFHELRPFTYESYDELQPCALKGAHLLTQMPHVANRMVELETGRGCPREKGCSFCTEPIKHGVMWRKPEFVIEEVQALMAQGARAFRLGKQSCIYSYEGGDPGRLEILLRGLAALKPAVLHLDNANPMMINEQRTELFVRYLTPGSTAAMGIESFDPAVTQANNLNCPYDMAFEAIRTVNRIGGFRGENGCHALLPGVNILLGLAGETPETLDRNFAALKRILDEGLLVRRINIRRVVPFPGTALYEQVGQASLRRNQRHYTPWIEKVRQEIDIPMLQRLFPIGTVLKDLCSEVHNGTTTFMRQIGSYPIVVGVWERLPLNEFFNVRITGYRRRSLLAERIK